MPEHPETFSEAFKRSWDAQATSPELLLEKELPRLIAAVEPLNTEEQSWVAKRARAGMFNLVGTVLVGFGLWKVYLVFLIHLGLPMLTKSKWAGGWRRGVIVAFGTMSSANVMAKYTMRNSLTRLFEIPDSVLADITFRLLQENYPEHPYVQPGVFPYRSASHRTNREWERKQQRQLGLELQSDDEVQHQQAPEEPATFSQQLAKKWKEEMEIQNREKRN